MFFDYLALVAVAGLTLPVCLMCITWLIGPVERKHKPQWLYVRVDNVANRAAKKREKGTGPATVEPGASIHDRRWQGE